MPFCPQSRVPRAKEHTFSLLRNAYFGQYLWRDQVHVIWHVHDPCWTHKAVERNAVEKSATPDKVRWRIDVRAAVSAQVQT
jgi:hypothetical protein